jgi:hypothetical protein
MIHPPRSPSGALISVTSGVTLAALVSTALLTALVTHSSFGMSIAQAHGDVFPVSLTDIAMAVFPLIATVIVAIVLDSTPGTLIAAWAAGATKAPKPSHGRSTAMTPCRRAGQPERETSRTVAGQRAFPPAERSE